MAPTGFRTHAESPLLDQLPTSSSSPRFRNSTSRPKAFSKALPLPMLVRERPLRVAFLVLLALVLSFLAVVSWAHLNPDTRLGREMHFFAPAEEWRKARVAFEKGQFRPLLGGDSQSVLTAGGKEEFGTQDEGHRNEVVELDKPESSNVHENKVLGVAQEGNVRESEADTENTGASVDIEEGKTTSQADVQNELGVANSSSTAPPEPHPVVAFVIKALSQFGFEKEPTLEAALLLTTPPKFPGSYSESGAGKDDDTRRKESVSVRQSLEHSTDLETSHEVHSEPDSSANKGQSEVPITTHELGVPKNMRKGTPLEQLRRVMPERRPNPIPNPEFWAKTYYGSGSSMSCDLGDGAWVEDAELEPLETANCRYTEGEQCAWRRESVPNYRSFRWLPYDCDLPFFDAESFLEQWRDKTVLVVGDSLGRNFFEALLCQLSAVGPLVPLSEASDREISDREQNDRDMRGQEMSDGVVDEREETDRETGEGEANNRERTDRGATELFWSERFNVTVGRVTSEFLVMRDTSAEELERFGQKAGKDRFLLSLDRLDPAWEALLPRIDLLILNSGHWWVSKSKRKAYLLGGELRRELDSSEAYKIAMRHVRDAVEGSGFKGVAMFRTFSDAHYHKGDWDTPGANCKNGRPEETIKLSSKLLRFLSVQEEIFSGSEFRLMEITRLTEYRHDGHVGPRKDLGGKWDCTHWCAGGVPNTWLDVMQAMLDA
ncbi:hypothetical protein KFL_000100380 [Klebsormidium nitens]|uniref:Pectin O-acetyltransferase 2 n=1 Tax=Klebsormidium nitens TaxID=105231 RepID=A0A1Y1HKW4_KLENI|nr:hypothetical protein KFL_000100380 [Klebsormidium nitens]|eukprot:GAQ78272.1 hypothetical protein KFL_000100380 [Klebsormidium nitens]